jgi:anti-sigma factor RsiW
VTCMEAEPLLNAYLDDELDLPGSLNVERHVADCPVCAAQYASLERVREEIAAADLRYRPGRGLERRIKSLRGPSRGAFGWNLAWRNPAMLTAVAVAAVLLLFIFPRHTDVGGSESREILDSHLRSLLSNHLVDVPSSDQHTVKPWFQGKTTFSPRVQDLSSSGFPLIGGRLEVIHRRPAAAIVYKRREHIINLYIAPWDGAPAKPAAEEIEGYHLVHWTENGLQYVAVSDLNAADLQTFAGLIRAK